MKYIYKIITLVCFIVASTTPAYAMTHFQELEAGCNMTQVLIGDCDTNLAQAVALNAAQENPQSIVPHLVASVAPVISTTTDSTSTDATSTASTTEFLNECSQTLACIENYTAQQIASSSYSVAIPNSNVIQTVTATDDCYFAEFYGKYVCSIIYNNYYSGKN